MILVEECRLRLDDPVTGLLPELADRRVLASVDGPLDDTLPAHRDITLRDLLTLRLGFGFLPRRPDETPIVAAAVRRNIGLGPPKPATPHPQDEWLKLFAELPLMHQPGERWTYLRLMTTNQLTPEQREGSESAPLLWKTWAGASV